MVFAVIFSIFIVLMAVAVLVGIVLLIVKIINDIISSHKNKGKVFSTLYIPATNKRPIYDTNGRHCGYYDSSNGTYWDSSGLVQTTPLGWRR